VIAAACRGCGQELTESLLQVDDVPVLCNELWPTVEGARGAASGSIALVSCPRCGLLGNAAFDPDLVRYSPAYENSLHFSATFGTYADQLARRLVDTFALHGKRILEIGAGSGDFLAALCELGGNEGRGVDPSYTPGRADGVAISGDRFEASGDFTADLVVCRHVLEHVPRPGDLLRAVRERVHAPAEDDRYAVYIEVPDADHMLTAGAVWDLIYEHPSFFSVRTLSDLLRREGFDPIRSGTSFHGQYAWVEAVPATRGEVPTWPAGPDLERLRASTAAFARTFTSKRERWRRWLHAAPADGVALWGAGSKGVTFLNVVDPDREIGAVVDINPRKHGSHVAGTGHEVVGPEDLAELRPRHVLLMNGAYEQEVRRTLDRLGIDAELQFP
jgi:SAM-dependent methyltransferase